MVVHSSQAVVLSNDHVLKMEVRKTASVRNLQTMQHNPQHPLIVSNASRSKQCTEKQHDNSQQQQETMETEEETPRQPQHAQGAATTAKDSVFSTYQLDQLVAEQTSARRNKRMLLARLAEVAPRGRLSMVRDFKYLFLYLLSPWLKQKQKKREWLEHSDPLLTLLFLS